MFKDGGLTDAGLCLHDISACAEPCERKKHKLCQDPTKTGEEKHGDMTDCGDK